MCRLSFWWRFFPFIYLQIKKNNVDDGNPSDMGFHSLQVPSSLNKLSEKKNEKESMH